MSISKPANATPTPPAATADAQWLATAEPVVLPLVEEVLEVGKVKIEKEGMRFRKVEETHYTEVQVSCEAQTYDIQRVTVNQPVAAKFEAYHDGDVLVVPVFEYVPVTEMRLMLKEEVRIAKRTERFDRVEPVQWKRERVEVQRRAAPDQPWTDVNEAGTTAATAQPPDVA
ncbi:YsnF/AvaK domain-containing protein [Chitinasiproducens palmae]|uniref:DUF2382 domain-containing protein n=1 Tax=Chitinasiproducens palmae TaxID=1770053 RepID=A0A1H2PN22_9BURK|nr:YsnF/AvaK domain-containing protein [Chitinasiproducens palmae]SDV47970.1 protein of unknown function [Chitinasiproducens palmae]